MSNDPSSDALLEAERRGTPFLLYRDARGRQHILELEGERELTIGRGSSCSLWLDWDDQVSRLHAELRRVGDEWAINDQGFSHNGTFVNGERVQGGRRLIEGDLIRVGSTEITYRAPGTADWERTVTLPVE